MRRAAIAATALLLLALTAGCSGSSVDGAAPVVAPTTARPTPTPEPFYGLSNAAVLRKAEAQVKKSPAGVGR